MVSPWKLLKTVGAGDDAAAGLDADEAQHHAAGMRTDPAPSEPTAAGTSPAATAAAEPPLEPPGVRVMS